MEINDLTLLDQILEFCEPERNYNDEIKKQISKEKRINDCKNHPLDSEVRELLLKLKEKIPKDGKELQYDTCNELSNIWEKLIKKAIMCLRFYDGREPFIKVKDCENGEAEKIPLVYGIEELIDYHEKYCDFEAILYGSNSFYRDHVFHAFRCWMLGVYCLLTKNKNIIESEPLIYKMVIEGETIKSEELDSVTDVTKKYEDVTKIDNWEKDVNEGGKIYFSNECIGDSSNQNTREFKTISFNEKYIVNDDNFSNNINILEKISMWTIIALCHDLGYPLEKSNEVIEQTRKMMSVFVAQPKIWTDISFNGVQDSINDYIIKFMSSKMKECVTEVNDREDRTYLGRIQPKYYLKYKKSLEQSKHGIISSIILYKMLLYFIEADNNLNDDYIYKQEEARQFYIRREILRAIASHTCKDIYQMELTTFTSLLFLCDEMQEWGRKSWKNIYEGTESKLTELELTKYNAKKVKFAETVEMPNVTFEQILSNVKRIFEKQYLLYKTTFRDGQYTAKRLFDIEKEMNIKCENLKEVEWIKIEYAINYVKKDYFKITIKFTGDKVEEEEKLFKELEELEKKLKKIDLDGEISVLQK